MREVALRAGAARIVSEMTELETGGLPVSLQLGRIRRPRRGPRQDESAGVPA